MPQAIGKSEQSTGILPLHLILVYKEKEVTALLQWVEFRALLMICQYKQQVSSGITIEKWNMGTTENRKISPKKVTSYILK